MVGGIHQQVGNTERETILKNWIIGIGLTILIIGIIAAVFVWRSFGQPLYTLGMVRAGENLRAPLTPPGNQTQKTSGRSNQIFNCITLPPEKGVVSW